MQPEIGQKSKHIWQGKDTHHLLSAAPLRILVIFMADITQM